MTTTALVVDLGGTHIRAAIASGPPVRLGHGETAPTAAVGDLAAWLEGFLDRSAAPRPLQCLIAIAGPVENGQARMTNADKSVDADNLGAALGMPVRLFNDFTAVAMAVPGLTDADRQPFGAGQPLPGHALAVLGPGTGLGVSGLIPNTVGWAPIAGEGGHARLTPGATPGEQEAYAALGSGFVAAEDVLSGPGLLRLYRALGGGAVDSPAAVAARAGHDPHAHEAVRLFTLWLGRFAGDLALILGARGGVYLAGGILPAWGKTFDTALFRHGFEDKAGYRDYVAAIPTALMTHPQPGLLGLAVAAGCG